MIESISGAAEDSAPDISSSAPPAPVSAAAAIAEMLAIEDMPASDDGRRAIRPAVAKSATLHARALGAVEDAVIANLLDNFSPSSRIAGFVLSEHEEQASRPLIARYYEDV
ncbi:hypothetical protein [Neorhizobium petrolearium]|uniref:hypothetical protein n=1 Tax=Neorhizobium petrolearium TaxID=515361 RepID=UPI003F1785B5